MQHSCWLFKVYWLMYFLNLFCLLIFDILVNLQQVGLFSVVSHAQAVAFGVP